MRSMKAVYTSAHLGHDVTHETYLGIPVPACEVTERAENIRAALETDGGFTLVAPTDHGRDPILAVHDPGLVRFVETAWADLTAQEVDRSFLVADTYPVRAMFEGMSDDALGRLREPVAVGGRTGWYGLDSSNPLVEGTWGAARGAVDVALTTVDLVLDGGEQAAYGLCRPPGHHAARAMAGGYCFFNNAAIAAESITRRTGEPVAILDVDVHHGNGTQQIFWRRGDVFYASIHADPAHLYPFFLGYADETGEGPGLGANFNQPLPAGTGDEAYLVAIDRALEAIDRTRGGIIVVSLGFDTYREDPIGTFALTTPAYHEIGRRVAALGRRLVILQEGGYHRPSLGANATAWLRGAEGRPLDPEPAGDSTPAGTRSAS
ncbi:MAG: histone deacetylase family protein [Chloroflexota bacterium]|nr:MAG: histone deacetylase family protein [Chloroflexota bacterium]